MADPIAPSTATPSPIGSWAERHLSAMGSRATLIVGDAPLGLLDWAAAELEAMEACWSRFQSTSELSDLNSSQGRWYPMSDRLAIAVDRALDLHWLTAGLFDPTVHDRLVELGYDRTFNRVVKDGDDDVAPGRPALGVAGVGRDGSHIRLPLGVRLDLGGIGKGLAADLLAEGMLDRGARSACVSLGGDIRAAGVTPEGRGWQVPVQDPWGSDVIVGVVPLADAAIVTSTTLIRTWRRKGRRIHHLIDPRSGEPATSDVVAAVVVAPEAWLAEGLAKAAIVAGSREAFPMLEGGGAAGWLACADGSLLATSVAGQLVSSESASS